MFVGHVAFVMRQIDFMLECFFNDCIKSVELEKVEFFIS